MDFWIIKNTAANRNIVVDAPLDKLPLFIKEKHDLAVGEESILISEQPDQQASLHRLQSSGNYHHYQDDGFELNLQNGEYNDYQVVEDDHVGVKI